MAFDRWISRENIRHYRDLLKDVKDPHRRSMLETLLSEEETKFAGPAKTVPETVDKVKHWRAKAEELRTIADHCIDPSARLTFSRLAESYEKMANETEGRWNRSGRKDAG